MRKRRKIHYYFECTYETGGKALVHVDWDAKLVWFSRNGGYQNRLADMPVEGDCMNCRFDYVSCTMTAEGKLAVRVDPVRAWEACIDHVCPDPTTYREERRRHMRQSVILADIQRALCLQDPEILRNPEMVSQLLDAHPLDYHPMSGRANFILINNEQVQ